MPKFVVHARSVAHVTHLIEVNGRDANEALENYWNGERGDVLGVQIGEGVDLAGMPDTAEPMIRGVHYLLPMDTKVRRGLAAKLETWADEIGNIPNMGDPVDGDAVAYRVASEMRAVAADPSAKPEAGPGNRKLGDAESYHFSRRILADAGPNETTAVLEWDGGGHVFRVERRAGRSHFVKTLIEHRFSPDDFAEALKHYEHAEGLVLAQDAERAAMKQAEAAARPVCPACGSMDARADCTAGWNRERDDWEILQVEGDLICGDCGEEFPEKRST